MTGSGKAAIQRIWSKKTKGTKEGLENFSLGLAKTSERSVPGNGGREEGDTLGQGNVTKYVSKFSGLLIETDTCQSFVDKKV